MVLAVQKMLCPSCGVAMNHHGDKVIYLSQESEGVRPLDTLERIDEIQACPNCGGMGSRPTE